MAKRTLSLEQVAERAEVAYQKAERAVRSAHAGYGSPKSREEMAALDARRLRALRVWQDAKYAVWARDAGMAGRDRSTEMADMAAGRYSAA